VKGPFSFEHPLNLLDASGRRRAMKSGETI
jgi:hypothetical protein